MIILGIDPGMARTGYGIIAKQGNNLTCVDFGCISTPAKMETAPRLRLVRKGIIDVIYKYGPEVAAIEKLFFAKNVKTALSVAHARGVILEAVASRNLPIYEYTPLQVKQAATSYGRAEKSQVQKMVKVLLALKEIPKPDDAADALAIAICCANTCPN
ncbi:MAG: crossover junction endodeoxyribonuclease RuvC [Candidatus Spechtbacterales bacterium]